MFDELKGPVGRYFGTDVTLLISILLPFVLHFLVHRRLVRSDRWLAADISL